MSDALRIDRDRILRARGGDPAAVAELYAAHRAVALRVAARLSRPADADDVVAEAFVRVLDQLRRGGGPQTSFRAYLLTAVRHVAADMAGAGARCVPTEVLDDLAGRTAGRARGDAGSDRRAESQVLSAALVALPARWRLVLWLAEVEDFSMSEIGARLGLNANAAAALAFRAREGLRNAYLAQHLGRVADGACATWRAQLPAHARGRLTARSTARVDRHLDRCPDCTEASRLLRGLVGAAR